MIHQRFLTAASLLACSASVTAFSLEDHPYIAPGPTDQRSPCPALSTLANHGFINRDGKNISVNELGKASAEVFSMDLMSVSFVIEKNIALGLPFVNTTDDIIFDLRFTAVVDRDVSAGWLDREFRTVDEPNECLVNKLISLNPGSDFLTPADLEEFASIRYHDSKTYNENLKFTRDTLELMGVQTAEMFTVSSDPSLETVNKTVLYNFLFHNRLADGYMPRNQTLPFQPKIDDSDPSALLIKRYTDLLTELDAGGTVMSMESETGKPMCIDEQPPAPPTDAPVEEFSSDEVGGADGASTWSMATLFTGTLISMFAMLL